MDSVQYDTESFLTQFDYGNDLQATFSYDSRDRLSTLGVKNSETTFLDLDYTYDNNYIIISRYDNLYLRCKREHVNEICRS